MRNRKRHTIQPTLERMELRAVPSVIGIHPHHEQIVASHVGRMNSSVKQASASERANAKALQNLQHQENLVHIHSLEHTPSAAPTEAEKAASSISNFFQSVSKSL